MKRPIMFAIASAFVFGLSAIAPASALSFERASQTIGYGDLRLDSDAGASTMLMRIREAASDVCGERTGLTPLYERRHVRACIAKATERAVADVGHANLYRVYYGRTADILAAN